MSRKLNEILPKMAFTKFLFIGQTYISIRIMLLKKCKKNIFEFLNHANFNKSHENTKNIYNFTVCFDQSL